MLQNEICDLQNEILAVGGVEMKLQQQKVESAGASVRRGYHCSRSKLCVVLIAPLQERKLIKRNNPSLRSKFKSRP